MISAHAVHGLAPALRDDEFALFQALIRRESGIALGAHKRSLLISRLAPRTRALGVSSFGEYYRRVTSDGGGDELVRMLDCICTNETRFFREPTQFELLERDVIPSLRRSIAAARGGDGVAPRHERRASDAATGSALRPGSRSVPADSAPSIARRIRVWSAACSTGEEPYSLAMTLLDRLAATSLELRSSRPGGSIGAPARVAIDILATDLSTRALEHARHAIWPLERASEIPTAYLHAYMLRGKGAHANLMKAGPEIRRLITFQRLNLTTAAPSRMGRFDLIFCRNVLIYFDAPTKAGIVEMLLDCLAPDGHLFLGHAEGLSGITDRVQSVAPTVYRLRPRTA